jgi:hypothetical protein
MSAGSIQHARSRGRFRIGIALCGPVLFGIVAVLLLRSRTPRPVAPPPPLAKLTPFALAACRGSVRHAEVEVESELLLHRALLAPEPRGGEPSEEVLLAAVQQQLRYAFAANQHDPAAAHLLTPAGPPHRIERTSTREVSYGRELALDWPADPDVKPNTEYVKRALARQSLRADEPALLVGYRARLRIAWCAYGGREPGPLLLPVPRDPYLLHWYVKKAQRTEQVYGKKRAHTFPCADSEIADYEHPEFLWNKKTRRNNRTISRSSVGERSTG